MECFLRTRTILEEETTLLDRSFRLDKIHDIRILRSRTGIKNTYAQVHAWERRTRHKKASACERVIINN